MDILSKFDIAIDKHKNDDLRIDLKNAKRLYISLLSDYNVEDLNDYSELLLRLINYTQVDTKVENVNNRNLLDEYVLYLKDIKIPRPLSENTINSYKSKINKVCKDHNIELNQINLKREDTKCGIYSLLDYYKYNKEGVQINEDSHKAISNALEKYKDFLRSK